MAAQKRWVKKSKSLQSEAIKELKVFLDEARKQVLTGLTIGEFTALGAGEIQEGVREALKALERKGRALLQDNVRRQYLLGVDSVSGPFALAGIASPAPLLSMETMSIMKDFSADLITGITDDALMLVNTRIRLGLLSGQGVSEVAKEIGKNLQDGVFGTVAQRAERIARTEMARVNSLGAESRMEQVIGANPQVEWKKRWVHSGKHNARPRHEALDGVEVPVNEDFPGGIPYPHAPGLPADEVINCGCSHILVADWDSLPSQFEPVPFSPISEN